MPAHAAQEFFAAQPIGLRVPGWILARSEYPARLRQTRHAHAPAYFSFVVRGAYHETVARAARHCVPGDLLFHPAAEEHSVAFQHKATSILRLELDSALLERLPLAPRRLQQPVHLTGGRAPWIARRIHAELQRTDRLAPLAIEGLALELLAEAFRPGEAEGRRTPQWLARAREIVESCYRERLTVAAIAEQAGAHRVTLARGFRAHFHQSVAERIRELRIRDACHALATSEQPLSEIAAEAGFCDQAHFTRAFRRLIGMAPGEFRRQHIGATKLQSRYIRSIQ
jgi:AraC family transcriptional regulator